eukprot:CAMPEP_0172179336 /NCGR_PEP_ID=MMETSP1050-20130122/16560_1 /TAXON_ID=233186 /ORGANISM="Cryptomonas curvata, Strain CCAP979/52" /LENGTH=67 /DNA_ID=CAMNT_0012852205 /DNA_START=120 /DNA_END=323 /DNA_ORIENTATION=-
MIRRHSTQMKRGDDLSAHVRQVDADAAEELSIGIVEGLLGSVHAIRSDWNERCMLRGGRETARLYRA